MSAINRILVMDADESMRNQIAMILRKSGFEVLLAEDALHALNIWRRQSLDFIILDVMMPVLDGLEVCRIMRKVSDIPVIFLTAKGEEQDVVNGFEAGANDYIIKPLRPNELIARIQAIIKRRPHELSLVERRLIFQDMELDRKAHQIQCKGKVIHLSPTDYKLLLYFIEHAGEVLRKEDLLNHVWGYPNVSGDLNLVDTAIRRLRNKIEDNPKKPRLIHTVWGTGYWFGSPNTEPANVDHPIDDNLAKSNFSSN